MTLKPSLYAAILSAGLLAGSGLAQTTPHEGHHAAAKSGEAMKVGKSDHTFMTKAAQGGMFEVKMAQVAQEKASSEEVKEFARMIEADHKKANEQLKELAQQKGVNLPEDMGPQHSATVERLSKLSGEVFDHAYVQDQIKDHKKDIQAFKQEGKSGMDSDVKQFAASTVPTLEKHLDRAQQLTPVSGMRSRKAEKKTETEMKK